MNNTTFFRIPFLASSLLVSLVFLCFVQCERIVEVDLGEDPKALLSIEGGVFHYPSDPTNGYQRIFLNRSLPFFSSLAQEKTVSGAEVTVTDNLTNILYTFLENDSIPGMYEVQNLVVELGREYSLRVEAELDGELQVFTGSDINQFACPQIEYVDLLIEQGFGGLIYTPVVGFPESLEDENFYLFQSAIDGNPLTEVYSNPNFFPSLQADSFINVVERDGEFFADSTLFTNFDNSDIAVEDIENLLFSIDMTNISEQSFFYHVNLYSNISAGTDVPAGKVVSNMVNTTFPDRFPVGYFMVGSKTNFQGSIEL